MMQRLVTVGGMCAALAAACADEASSPELNPQSSIVLIESLPIPQDYGIHDMQVRDGLAFVCAWNTGVIIYDVGNGINGGAPGNPKLVGGPLVTTGGAVHNAWWYHSPTGERKYLFIGQEGPGRIGATSSGDIHVVDVSDLMNPHEVGFYHMDGAGTHNFWVDEINQILYAAYYDGGVVAIGISGTLPDSLAKREISRIRPGGPGNTYVWGVQRYDSSLYVSDMLT